MTESTEATSNVVRIGDRDVRIERVSALKASRAFAIMRGLEGAAAALARARAEFVRTYEDENIIELDRAQARLHYPERPVLRDGEVITGPDGKALMAPSELASYTEADWAASGNVLRLKRTPSDTEVLFAVFPTALDVAEEQVYDLMALFVMSNEDVKRYWRGGTLREELTRARDDLLADAFADDLVELGVVLIEVITGQFRSKTEALGDRVGKALSRIGLGQTPARTSTSTTPRTSSSPTSSTDSPPSTDGESTTSSTPPTTSPLRSVDESTETPIAV